jgi:hypothetical protein
VRLCVRGDIAIGGLFVVQCSDCCCSNARQSTANETSRPIPTTDKSTPPPPPPHPTVGRARERSSLLDVDAAHAQLVRRRLRFDRVAPLSRTDVTSELRAKHSKRRFDVQCVRCNE